MTFLTEAKDPNTTHDRLRELAKKNSSLAMAVLTNPNTPIELAAQIRKQFTGRGNEAPDEETLERLTKEAQEQTEPARLEWLSQFGGYVTRAVARNAYTPLECLRLLASHEDDLVRCELLRNPAFSGKEMEGMAGKKSFMYRVFAASSKTPPERLLALASSKRQVRKSVAQNPNTPLMGLIRLWLDRQSGDVRFMEASIKERNDERSQKLAPWLGVLRGLSRHAVWNYPFVQAELNKEEPSAALRETLLQVSRVPSFYVPEDDLKKMVAGEMSLIPQQMTRGYYTTREYLASQATNQNASIRAQVALNYRADATLLESLSNDADLSVRVAVARNGQTPIAVLSKLAKEDNPEVLTALVQNYRLPAEDLDKIADSKHTSVRILLATKYQTSLAAVTRLCTDKELEVRQGVAKRPYLTKEVLLILARDADPSVRLLALKNPRAAIDVFALLAKDREVSVRLAVAKKVRASADILSALGKDRSKQVRLAVAKNKKSRLRTLERLLNDRVPEIQEAAKETIESLAPASPTLSDPD
jgi:hypothetical protein